MPLTALLFRGNRLDARLELIIMRIGWRTGSVYEWTQHWRVARGLGIPEANLAATRDWRGAPNLTKDDRAVLQATDDTLDGGMIGDATWEACCRRLATHAERKELVVAIGNWTMFSQLLKSCGFPCKRASKRGRPTARSRRSIPGAGEGGTIVQGGTADCRIVLSQPKATFLR